MNSGGGYLLTLLRDGAWTLSLFLAAAGVACFAHRPFMRLDGFILRCRRGPLLAVCAIISALVSLLFSYFVLDHMPHIQDEIAMVFQAENFAKGHLYAAAPPQDLRLFFDYDSSSWTPAWYGKYFFGRPCC